MKFTIFKSARIRFNHQFYPQKSKIYKLTIKHSITNLRNVLLTIYESATKCIKYINLPGQLMNFIWIKFKGCYLISQAKQGVKGFPIFKQFQELLFHD